MNAKRVWKYFKEPGRIAFLLVVLAAYLSTFLLNNEPLPALKAGILIGLGLLYLALGIFLAERFESSPASPFVYFFIQLVIAGSIIYLAQFYAWLVLLPLSSQTVFLFSRRWILIANALILAVFAGVMALLGTDLRELLQAGIAFLNGLFFVVVFTQIRVNEQKARAEVERLAEELRQANQRQREYASQIETLATEQERNRLAREIHDGLGHYLTALNMQIKAAAAVMAVEPERAYAALDKAQSLTQDALADVRRSVAALRGDPALSRPLPEALEHLIEETRSAGLVANLAVCGAPRRLSPQVDLTLYRAVQEGLTNVRKHSLASRVDVQLEYAPERVKLTLQDNGVGLPPDNLGPDAPQAGFGLFGLSERAGLLGGSVEVNTAPGAGFRLAIELPAEGREPFPVEGR